MSKLLVSVEELAAHINAPNWRVFDCRHDLQRPEYGPPAYAAGHIPGALYLHLDRDLSGSASGSNGRHPLPNREILGSKLARCGVSVQTQVVAYDNEGGVFAARLWWLLRWLGHERVAVLDGGLAAWKRAKLPLQQQAPEVGREPASPLSSASGFAVVDADYVLAHLGGADMLLLDARNPERFRGENETIDPVGGHIPGAVNRFYQDNLDDNGCFFKPATELRADFDALLAGHSPTQVIQQCGSGVSACHNLLAMEVAGLQGSRLYPGSWSEWCSDPVRPVATGPA